MMEKRKFLFINSAPFLDENFNPVKVTLRDARRKANQIEREIRKLNWGLNVEN